MRVFDPGGQFAFLSWLTCPLDAKPTFKPTFKGIGSFGTGVYGRIIDG